MRTVITILLAMLATTAAAQAPTPEEINAILAGLPQARTFPKFDTMEEAAVAALKEINKQPVALQAYEWGGVIGKYSTGKFTYSPAATDYQGDNVGISAGGLDPGAEPVAGYHTHPCIPEHLVEFFSPPDLVEVIFGHHPATFMGDFCTGNVHEFMLGDQPDVIQLGSPGR